LTANQFGQTIREQSPCFPIAVVPSKGIVEETILLKASNKNNKANNKSNGGGKKNVEKI
jgi:hypothetical protein